MQTDSSLFFIGLGSAGKALAVHLRQRPFLPLGQQPFTIVQVTDETSLEKQTASFPRASEPKGGASGQTNVTTSSVFLTADLDASTAPLVASLSQQCLLEPSWFTFFILVLPFRDDANHRQSAESTVADLLQRNQQMMILDRDWLARRWSQRTTAELEKLAVSWVIDNSRTNMATFLKKPGKAVEPKSMLLVQEPLEQLNLELPEMSAGIFTGDTPSFYRGQNYDFPTFQRLGIKPGS